MYSRHIYEGSERERKIKNKLHGIGGRSIQIDEIARISLRLEQIYLRDKEGDTRIFGLSCTLYERNKK